jgi:release factor glutamine methyltransferase
MTMLKELRDRMVRELSAIYPAREAASIIGSLIFSVTGIDRKAIAFEPGMVIKDDIEKVLQDMLEELKAYKPVQYVTGQAHFYGLDLSVNPSVLIPRPETEELVKWAADDHKDKPGLKVLDIGTGSGCIILAISGLLLNPKLEAFDISEDAIKTASANALRYNIKVEIKKISILDEIGWSALGEYDLIISNPPYIRESEKRLMQANVLDYEPQLALFVSDDDPLLFYRAIAGFSKQHLSKKGKLYLEINENLGNETVNILKVEGFSEVVLRKDISGKDRMIRAGRQT